MRRHLAALSAAAIALGAGSVLADQAPRDESGIQLQEAPGRELTASHCASCHSLDYIPMNAPVMDAGSWKKSIQKMRERFGAPLTDAEAAQVLDYLSSNYSHH
jgi:mono/diheme cytochrome c family protein